MAQTPPLLEIGQRGLIAPKELSPHALTAHQPWMAPVRFAAFATDVQENGVIEDILITPNRDIANGRHRWKAHCVKPYLTQACLPYRVIAEEDVAKVVLETTLARRHYSKSARAFMALDLIAEAVRVAAEVKAQNLKAGTLSSRRPIQSGVGENGSPLAQLAAQLGISTDYLTLAQNTERLFAQSDAKIEKWKTAHPELAEEWEARDTEVLADWQAWRAEFLLSHGIEDPKSAAAAAACPEDYRAIYTARLFSDSDGDDDDGPMSLCAINKAVGSAMSTKGGSRPDTDSGNAAMHLTLAKKIESFGKTMWSEKAWGILSAEHRMELAGKLSINAREWPAEVRAAVLAQLKTATKTA